MRPARRGQPQRACPALLCATHRAAAACASAPCWHAKRCLGCTPNLLRGAPPHSPRPVVMQLLAFRRPPQPQRAVPVRRVHRRGGRTAQRVPCAAAPRRFRARRGTPAAGALQAAPHGSQPACFPARRAGNQALASIHPPSSPSPFLLVLCPQPSGRASSLSSPASGGRRGRRCRRKRKIS